MKRINLIILVSLIFSATSLFAMVDTSYAFIVSGHAYGSHDGDNTGLHPPDSIEFTLVPLDSDMSLPGIEFYSVPPAPDPIVGPATILPESSAIEYSVPEVFNADTYIWELPVGATGNSNTNQIQVNFDMEFSQGDISVRAARDGFGSGPAAFLTVNADSIPDYVMVKDAGVLTTSFRETGHSLVIGIHSPGGEPCSIRIFDINGRTIRHQTTTEGVGYTQLQINKSDLPGGIILLSASTRTHNLIEKIIVRQ